MALSRLGAPRLVVTGVTSICGILDEAERTIVPLQNGRHRKEKVGVFCSLNDLHSGTSFR